MDTLDELKAKTINECAKLYQLIQWTAQQAYSSNRSDSYKAGYYDAAHYAMQTIKKLAK